MDPEKAGTGAVPVRTRFVVAGPAHTVRHKLLLAWTAIDALAYTTGHELPPSSGPGFRGNLSATDCLHDLGWRA
jgi:hypothetical protein